MNSHARRQLKDIQSRAEHLMNGHPTIEEITDFDQYNEELKKYLLENLSDAELLERVRQIPRILAESEGQKITRGALVAFLSIFTTSLASYLEDKQQIENAKENIRDARGAYATIEFFTRSV